MNIGDIFLRMLVDDKTFAADVTKKAGKAGDEAGKTMGQRMSAGINKGLAILGIGFGASKILDFLGDAKEAFKADEQSIASLNTALAANVEAWDGNTDAIEKTIAARMRLGFSDDEQRASLDSLVAVTKDAAKALDVQRIAMDLARLRSIDLATATDILSKVAGGNIGILSRYGIQIRKGASATEALAEIQKLAAGQAEAFAKTQGGKAAAAAVKAAEAQERMGKVLAQLEAKILPVLADALTLVVDALEALGVGAVESFEDLEEAAENGSQGAAAKVRILNQVAEQAGVSVERLWEKMEEGLSTGEAVAAIHEEDAAALRHMADATKDDTVALDGLTDAYGDATDASGDLEDATRDLRSAYERLIDTWGDAESILSDLSGAMFDAEIMAGDLAQAERDLADLMKEQPARGDADAWVIWSGKVAEAEQDVFDLQAQMAMAAGPEAFYDWLVKQEKQADKTNAKLLTLIARLKFLQQLAGAGVVPESGKPVPKGGAGQAAFAEGGFLPTGGTGVVGEEGQELIHSVPGGTVITPMEVPSNLAARLLSRLAGALDRAPAGGTTNNLNLTFTGRVGDEKEDVVSALTRAAAFVR